MVGCENTKSKYKKTTDCKIYPTITKFAIKLRKYNCNHHNSPKQNFLQIICQVLNRSSKFGIVPKLNKTISLLITNYLTEKKFLLYLEQHAWQYKITSSIFKRKKKLSTIINVTICQFLKKTFPRKNSMYIQNIDKIFTDFQINLPVSVNNV